MTDQAWKTLSQELAYSCDGFDIVNETVELPDGSQTEFDYLTESESVVIIPFTGENEVVVIDEWRHAVRRYSRGLPAGSIESDEQPMAAVHRELTEETGYEAESIEHLTTVEPSNGFSDAVFHYYAAYDCEPSGEQQLDSDETIRVSTTTVDELLAAIENDDFPDGRSAFGITYYALFEAQ